MNNPDFRRIITAMEKKLLISDKWRPKTFEDLLLLPRVKSYFSNPLSQNVILYGGYGIGKTSLARVIIGKYTKSSPHIEINSSYYTSIDTLRGKIEEFCSKVFLDFDAPQEGGLDFKYVFLDEFERTSLQYQDALKAYIEDYSVKNVRFILSTNHLSKISPGIRSRFIEINMDPQNSQEEKYLKIEMFKKIWERILPSEDIKMEKSEVLDLVKKKFPDLRSILVELDYYKSSGCTSIGASTLNSTLIESCYGLIYNQDLSYEDIFHFINNNFGADRIEEFLSIYARGFIMWHIENRAHEPEKLFKYNWILSEILNLLPSSSDPLVCAMAFVGRIREVCLN